MEHILKNTKTYSHDNGLGFTHSYKYVFDTGKNVYECTNGVVIRHMKKGNIILGVAKTKQEFANMVKVAQKSGTGYYNRASTS